MSEANPATAFEAHAERHRGTVHLVMLTDQGRATVRFTPALAKLVGRDLDLKSIRPVGERREETRDKGPETRDPILKPGGAIL